MHYRLKNYREVGQEKTKYAENHEKIKDKNH